MYCGHSSLPLKQNQSEFPKAQESFPKARDFCSFKIRVSGEVLQEKLMLEVSWSVSECGSNTRALLVAGA